MITHTRMLFYTVFARCDIPATIYKRLFSHGLITIGDKASTTRVFTAADVKSFSELTGDVNPIHVDAGTARESRFGACIVHGVLTVGLLSSVMGVKLPGPGSIVLSYDIVHPEPLFVDELVKAEVTVKQVKGRQMTLDLLCTSCRGKVVTKGVARLFVPKHKVKDYSKRAKTE